ncbi:MAG: hypothetical protein AYK19_05120 [Theionarchaea archaeon DG-70-1]|nr:MAG: hypothetical protein AYK19_05120 [Theionarchaea archaeon DG-70-1]
MKRKYKYFIGSVILIAAFITSLYVLYRQAEYFNEEFQEKLTEEKVPGIPIKVPFPENIRSVFEFNVLTEEEEEQAETIAQSDEVVNAILHVLGDTEVEAYRGPVRGRATLKYSSEKEWMLQVTVNLDSQRVESITLTRGIIPMVINPKELVQIAEKEFPRNEFGTPFLRKVDQSDEGAEVVFLTDKGTVIVRVNQEEGKVVHLEKHAARAHFWWLWFILPIGIVVGVAILLVILKRRSEAEPEEEPLEELEEGQAEEPEEGKEGGSH